jgi:hypothetical protein
MPDGSPSPSINPQPYARRGERHAVVTTPSPTDPRLREQLNRQLGYLERSAALYDAGHREEAVRLATTIRVLVHDTRNSISLLRHLGGKGISLASTAKVEVGERPGRTLHAMEVLLTFTARGMGPKTDPRDIQVYLPVKEWWSQVVHIHGAENRLTRKDIVLFAANKDGGAHVDDELSASGKRLLEGAWVRISGVGADRQSEVLRDHHFLMLRTMAFEILNSPELRKLADDTT